MRLLQGTDSILKMHPLPSLAVHNYPLVVLALCDHHLELRIVTSLER